MQTEKTYNLTFTAGTLLLNETYAVAETYLESGCDWGKTQTITFEHNLMSKDKVSTNKRFFSLVKQRISALNEEELDLLVNSTVLIRRQMLLLAICKAHALIFDFISVNVRDSFFAMQERVTHANFNEFFNEKKYVHPELEAITDLTVAKIRQVVFRILEQAELIESIDTGLIQRPYLSEKVERVIVKDNPKWLAAFLYSNNEINNAAVCMNNIDMDTLFEGVYQKLISPDFSKNLGGELPLFIQPIPNAGQTELNAQTERLATRLSKKGKTALIIDLYQLCMTLLEEEGVLETILEEEPNIASEDIVSTIDSILDMKSVVIPRISEQIQAENPNYVLITGVGRAYPFCVHMAS